LKDCLRDTLKELKIINSNEEGLKKIIVQCDQMLEGLKAKNGHAVKKRFEKTSKFD
jgi:hypothetical protein